MIEDACIGAQKGMANKREAATYLRRAASFLDYHNWGRGYFHNTDDNAYCAIGALREVAGGPMRAREIMWCESGAHARQLCNALTGSDVGSIYTYNDGWARGKEDVQRFLRGIAYMLEHGGRLPKWAEVIKDKREDALARVAIP